MRLVVLDDPRVGDEILVDGRVARVTKRTRRRGGDVLEIEYVIPKGDTCERL